jgi:type IV pilus biogenesis protein CpaD/CtpE
MTRRLAAVAILALSLAACDSTSPTTSPTATKTPARTASPSTVASAEPSAAVRIDEQAYLVGDAFMMPIDEVGMSWLTPA